MAVPRPVREGLNLLDGAWYADRPHDIWTWMRTEAPVYFDESSRTWGIAKHEDVLAIETDARTFSSSRAPRPHGYPLPMMISMDDPEHQRRRSLVNRGFTPKRVAAHEETVERLCRSIIDKVCETGSCDFVWDIAAPLPLLIIADLLGFGPELHDDLLRWSDDVLRGTSLALSDEVIAAATAGMQGFRSAQLDVIAQRRAEPRDDLISTLVNAEIEGERLDDESIVNETLLILIGGDETTRHVITEGTLALLDFPDQMALWRDDEGVTPTAIEELLRWVSPVKNMARTVTVDTEVRGQQLHEGDQLILFYPSANRDEDVFDDPQRLDLRRSPNPHIAFGFGPHFCLGASLARLELRIMFREVLRRMPDLRLATDEPLEFRKSNFITGPEAMPVVFTPTPALGPVA